MHLITPKLGAVLGKRGRHEVALAFAPLVPVALRPAREDEGGPVRGHDGAVQVVLAGCALLRSRVE